MQPHRIARAFALGTIFATAALAAAPLHAGYIQSNLVSDIPGVAAHTDPNLVNAWGLSFGPTTPFWVSDNGMGVATLYNGTGQAVPPSLPLVVTIPPPPGGTPPSAPTGQVFNGTSSFGSARFIFATEEGTISSWAPGQGTSATLKVDSSAAGAIYKGLALGDSALGPTLYAADFHNGKIDVFDGGFAPRSLAGNFTDPNLPAGYAPFNIQNLDGQLYVTYAKQDAAGTDEVAGVGNGFVDVYDVNGHLLRRIASDGQLNAPWGLALAPADFGEFSNDLLVGNFGDGAINAFDPVTDAFLGQLQDVSGARIEIDGLWALAFGNGTDAAAGNRLFFTAGPDDETHGLFGSLSTVPEPSSLALVALPLLILYRRRARP